MFHSRLDTSTQTLVLGCVSGGLPAVLYWGAPLPAGEDLAALAASRARPVGPAMLDEPINLSLCPEQGWAFPGHPGLLGGRPDGTGWLTQFEAVESSDEDGRFAMRLRDEIAGLALELCLTLDPDTDVLEARTAVTNDGGSPYRLDWLACPVLPAPEESREMLGIFGRWSREFQPQRLPWAQGQHVRENRLGRTSHEHFPGLIVPLPGCGNTGGDAYGFHLGWSGDHRMVAEELPDGRRQVQFGTLHAPGEVILAPGERYETPCLYASYSSAGLNGLSWAFKRHLRQKVISWPKPARPRPVHYNCWEAVYFDHDLETLKDLAGRAAAVGAELFVLDDGWSKGRNDDSAGLGDWWPDAKKYPDGLKPLIDHVRDLGMRFGLWVEPEMVNRESDLFRAHPDWILDIPDYRQIIGRNQYVLDLTRDEVAGYLFDAMDQLLREHAVEYLKWDMNRSLTLTADAAGRPASRRQVLALYALIDRLRAAHPAVEIESCASGGGRIDYGVLGRTHRVWLSDSNDARTRWRMQHGASLFLPPEITGSHVGPRICHTTGRQFDMAFRAWVAASRHMGMELDLREMTEEETVTLRGVVDFYKANRDLLHHGRLHRLDSPEPAMLAEMTVAGDGGRFLVFAGQLDMQAHGTTKPLKLTGLAPEARYSVRLVAPAPESINRIYENPLASEEGVALSGAALMTAGLIPPIANPDTIWVFEGIRL